MRSPLSISWLLAAAVGIGGLVACRSNTPASGASDRRLVPAYNKESGRLTELKYDRNKDGKMDTWATMDGLRVVRIEIDENADGKADRWEHYKTGSPAGAPAVLERVESATRHDGHISRREFLEDGRLARIEEDTDGDGSVDKWETYEDGALVRMELDTQGRGRPDRRFLYGPGGELERIEADPDGSGQFRPLSQAR